MLSARGRRLPADGSDLVFQVGPGWAVSAGAPLKLVRCIVSVLARRFRTLAVLKLENLGRMELSEVFTLVQGIFSRHKDFTARIYDVVSSFFAVFQIRIKMFAEGLLSRTLADRFAKP